MKNQTMLVMWLWQMVFCLGSLTWSLTVYRLSKLPKHRLHQNLKTNAFLALQGTQKKAANRKHAMKISLWVPLLQESSGLGPCYTKYSYLQPTFKQLVAIRKRGEGNDVCTILNSLYKICFIFFIGNTTSDRNLVKYIFLTT